MCLRVKIMRQTVVLSGCVFLAAFMALSGVNADSYNADQAGQAGIVVGHPDVLTLGFGICTPLAPGTPLECPGPGDFIFDATHFTGHGATTVEGTCKIEKLQSLPGSLRTSCAVDRDDDFIITNADPTEDDSTHDHGTNADFDDQFYTGSIDALGISTTVGVCFAHDAEDVGHSWDDIIVFVDNSVPGAPYAGDVKVTLDLDDGSGTC